MIEEHERRGETPPDVRDTPEDRRRRELYSTYMGGTGGFFVLDGRLRPAGLFGVQLGIEFFKHDGFLLEGDEHSRVGGALSLTWSLHDLVEVHVSANSRASTNLREFPILHMVLADIALGAKVGGALSEVIALAGDFRLNLPTSGRTGIDFSALGFTAQAILSADLRALNQGEGPALILRANVGYTFDQSAKLIARFEDYRASLLQDFRGATEDRHLLTRVERHSLGISRLDFLELAIGAEIPIQVSEKVMVSPIAEYHLRVPINRQNFVCPLRADHGDPEVDSCAAEEGIASYPSVLTLGVRVRPAVPGLDVFAALDIGISGAASNVAVHDYGSVAPWRILLGLSYVRDTRDPPAVAPLLQERVYARYIESPPTPRGRVHGEVVDQDGVPIPGARVRFLDREGSDQRAGESGEFTTFAFTPGPVTLEVSAEGMNPEECAVEIPDPAVDVTLRCALEQRLVEVEESAVVILQKIQFAFDSDEILAESFPLMQQIADVLTLHTDLRLIEVQGHTSDEGADDYNLQLSQRRAESVMRWLVEAGIDPARLRARGYGEARLLEVGQSDEARSRNRRVELQIVERSLGEGPL